MARKKVTSGGLGDDESKSRSPKGRAKDAEVPPPAADAAPPSDPPPETTPPSDPPPEVLDTEDIPPTVLGSVAGGAGLAADTTVEVTGPDGGPAQVIDVHPSGAVRRQPGAAVHSFSGRAGAAITDPAPRITTHGNRGGASVVIQAPAPRAKPRREADRKNDTRSAARPLSLRDFELREHGDGGAVIDAHAEHESGGSINRRWGQIPIGESCGIQGILVSEPALKYARPKWLRITRARGGGGGTYRLMVVLDEEAPNTPLIDASKLMGVPVSRTGLFETLGYAITEETGEGPAQRAEVEVNEGDVVSILWEATGNRRCMHYVCLVPAG